MFYQTSCQFLDEILLTEGGLVGLITQVVQGTAHLNVDILRAVKVGEGAVQYVHNLVDALQRRLVVAFSRTKLHRDHLLDVADFLKVAVLVDNTLILSLLKPITVATGNLCQKLGIELRIVDRREIVYLFLHHNTDEPS